MQETGKNTKEIPFLRGFSIPRLQKQRFFWFSNKKNAVFPCIFAGNASNRRRKRPFSVEHRNAVGVIAAHNFSQTGGTNDNGEEDWK
ncbi:MAG: hypothetical protein CMJ56_03645 [Planctomycetaceae bacterium]|nr:hypothetical protein [Planctomycetaceae bacterium]